MSDPQLDRLLDEQIAYYRARANEYDDWFWRRGRYDRGPEVNQRWLAEASQVARALDGFAPRGQVLELAAGTGLWTQRLVQNVEHLTAVDASPEVLAINRARVGKAPVEYIQADLFSWRPDRRYDVVFFGFWLSHVPPERFEVFWEMVRSALAPGGRVFFVDSLYNESSTALDHRLEGPDSTTALRRLDDGREFRIVKVFYRPRELERRLADLGWDVMVRETESYFLYGWS